MSQPALSLTPAPPADPPAAANAAPAEVVAMPRKAGFDSARFKERLSETAGKVLPPVGMLLIVLLIWQGLTSAASGGLPAPTMVWMESKDLILNPFFDHGGVDKGLFWHVLTSLKRVAVGYGFAAVAGIALGVLVGSSTLAHRGLDPIFQVLRTVPPLAWLPISLAALREANPSALFVIFITAIWPIIINTAVGVRNIPQDYVNVGRVLRLSPLDYFFTILLPAATPYIFTGLRIGVGMSWLAIVASEMLLGGVGIGFFIWDQYNSSRISDIIVALVWVGLVGFALDRLIAFVGNLVTRGSAAN
jgi:nitrate/nitrite transport system permease protein